MKSNACKSRVGVLAVLSLFAGMVQAQATSSDPTVVKVDTGLVRGVQDGSVISWKGMPYAAPPTGSLRWRNPQPAHAWKGIREARTFGPSCLQADPVPKSEDCLTLNVWRPARSSTQPVPVMVWIYGGAMVHGGAQLYPADALARQGVLVVTINYRLGRLGFFAHPALAAEAPDEVRGNYGYMDQRAALLWVQRNIAAFDGDPGQVTIFGESAGGGSVLAHLVSPMSRGLFQRAILQSPGTPGPRAGVIPSTDLATAERMAVDWAASHGVSGQDAAALPRLRALSPKDLLAGASGPETVALLSAGKTPTGMAMSIIDGRFLTERPEAALAAGHQAKVPTIIGANDRDLPVGKAESKDALFAQLDKLANMARKLYDPRGDQTLDELKQQAFADRAMAEPARHFAEVMARTGQPVWLYRFGYVSESQRGKLMGTPHGLEIPFTMNLPAALVKDKVTPTDKAMGDMVSAYWVQFGLTGNPNGGGRTEWPSYDPATDRIMHFTSTGAIAGTDPFKPRLDLWKQHWEDGR